MFNPTKTAYLFWKVSNCWKGHVQEQGITVGQALDDLREASNLAMPESRLFYNIESLAEEIILLAPNPQDPELDDIWNVEEHDPITA